MLSNRRRDRAARASLAALLALAIAAPAALAQSAGDNQYQDPFGPGSTNPSTQTHAQSGSSGSANSGSSNSGSSNTSLRSSSGSSSSGSGSNPMGSSPSWSSTMPGSTGVAASASGQLPRTGTDARGLALLGFGVLLAGVGLRRALRLRAY